jgi:hypothetical protein
MTPDEKTRMMRDFLPDITKLKLDELLELRAMIDVRLEDERWCTPITRPPDWWAAAREPPRRFPRRRPCPAAADQLDGGTRQYRPHSHGTKVFNHPPAARFARRPSSNIRDAISVRNPRALPPGIREFIQ